MFEAQYRPFHYQREKIFFNIKRVLFSLINKDTALPCCIAQPGVAGVAPLVFMRKVTKYFVDP
jgi:hypothetical protein